MDKETNLLKIKDVADLLGVTTRTVYRRIWAGELPATKIGGLYYIKPSDIGDIIEPAAAVHIAQKTADLKKCGSCLKVLRTADQVAATCTYQGCQELICKECAAKGIYRCRKHKVTEGEKWSDALAAHQAGELTTLVRANQARLRELNYLNRIQARIAQIETLIHPQDGELITVKDWEHFKELGDERAEVLRLKGRVLLDTRDTVEYPMNAWLSYHIPAEKKNKSLPLEINVKVLSHLQTMVEDGFDSQPLTDEDLSAYLVKLDQYMKNEPTFRITVLAATTGWDEAAAAVIAPKTATPAFAHPRMLIYLFDLETNTLIYSDKDIRLGQYAELFKPLLISEEAIEAQNDIERLLYQSGHGSLTVQDALKLLPYSEQVIKEAFKTMAAKGRYRLIELDDIGTAIQQII